MIWNDAPAGRHRLRIEVEDDLGERFVSRETILTVAGPALSAAIAADGLHLQFLSHTNSNYIVLSSGNLQAWRTNSPALEGTGAAVTWQEPCPTAPELRRFFRLQVLPRP